jgi:branched-chain amino acid transport system ATP-binding protein
MLKCKLILLDEPFAGVNPVLFDEISTRLIELNRRGIGLLIIEHNIQALARLVGHIYVLNDGAILAQGTPDEVLSSEAVQRAYMGDAV